MRVEATVVLELEFGVSGRYVRGDESVGENDHFEDMFFGCVRLRMRRRYPSQTAPAGCRTVSVRGAGGAHHVYFDREFDLGVEIGGALAEFYADDAHDALADMLL